MATIIAIILALSGWTGLGSSSDGLSLTTYDTGTYHGCTFTSSENVPADKVALVTEDDDDTAGLFADPLVEPGNVPEDFAVVAHCNKPSN